MRTRLIVLWLAAVGGCAVAVLARLADPLQAVSIALALVVAVGFAHRSGALAGARQLPRARTAASALLLAALGVVFWRVLVANPSDNAYLWIWLSSVLLVGIAVPLALAALIPWGSPRRWLAQSGIALLWGVGAPAALLLFIGGPLYLLSSQAVPPSRVDQRVVLNHTLGGLALGAAIWLIGYHWPRRSRPSAPGAPRAGGAAG